MPEGRTSEASRQVRIDTWKSIACYLGRSSRTVQRWHREYGLPVHRLGVDTGSIFAYADELDAWLRNAGLAPQNTLFEIAAPEPGRSSYVPSEPEQCQRVIDPPCIPRSRRQRSAAMVAFANQLWVAVSTENLKMIAKAFREAADLDPGNAAAFAGLSHALIAQGLAGSIRAPGAYIAAKAALERAIAIDPKSLETRCASAWLKIVLDRDWHGARRGLDDCLKQHPAPNRALVGRALLHIAEGCPGQAVALLREFVREHALNAEAAAMHCWSTYLSDDPHGALRLVEESRAGGQSGTVLDAVEALASIRCEKPEVCIPRIETLVADSPSQELLRGALGYAFARNGMAQKATAILDIIARAPSSERNAPYAIALVLIGLDEKHDAVRWLEQSYRSGSLWSLGFASDPIVQSLRDEPAFRMFLSAAGYPALYRHGPASEGSSIALTDTQRVSGLASN